ncbi:S8 family serine peptidase [Mariprofundus ferrooxydans]|nr:S8 family serine peptidase [Mariprofundus ferrooxydans]
MQMKTWMMMAWFCMLFSANQASAVVNMQPLNAAAGSEYVDRLIVKMRAPQGVQIASSMATVMNANQMATISGMVGVQMTYVRRMAGQAHVLKLPSRMPIDQAMALANNLANNPAVQYAEPDRMLHPMRVPNDPLYAQQWHYDVSANHGMNLPAAWDISIGAANVITAVIDTGILPNHSDFAAGRLLPGFDMISNLTVANDGNGRDPDPTDPGDAVIAGECGVGSQASNSSWHGTHVSGTIGAATNNGIGVAGVDWTGKILPVRALGKCGGPTSDIIDAMAWAAGIAVAGVPNNPNPADVLNLSLGGTGACSAAEQAIITQIVALGKVIVVAAGNANTNTNAVNPASCTGVIAVAAHGPASLKAGYSNFGAEVAVMAPGGEQIVNGDANGVLSTLDGGTTVALNDNAFVFYQGTSMASPHVAGLVALMFAVNPTLSPAQVKSALQNSVRPFVAAGFCASNPNNCGTGIVDAQATLAAVSTASPAAPTTLSAIAVSATQINLAWVDASSNETGFKIERSADGGTTFVQIATTAANATSFANTGLPASTTFHYRVRAFNNFINSAFTATANTTTLAFVAAPTTLIATAASSSQINLTWVDASNNETGFKIERSSNGGVTFTQIATTAANANSFNNTGLPASTTFHYRVRAFNNFINSTFTATANAATLADTTPPVITIQGNNPTFIQVGQTYADAGAVAIDNHSGAVNVTSTVTVNKAIAGVYSVTYSATDTANNTATAIRVVKVMALGTTVNGTTAQIALAGSAATVDIVSANEIISNFSTSTTTGTPPPTGVSFPFGLVSYSTTVPSGSSQTVNLTFSTILPVNLVLYKVNNAGVYTLIPNGNGTDQWTQVNANTVAVTLLDGGTLDLDPASGVIIDPVGVGSVAPLPTAAIGGAGGGGGCVINTGRTPFDPLLPLLLLLSLIGFIKARMASR